MNGDTPLDDGDVSQEPLSPHQLEARRIAKGKGRARPPDDSPILEEEPESPIIDEEQEEREAKAVEETLRRWSELEKNRRASRRRNAASVTVTPPLADLSRRGSKLLNRARTRRSGDSSRQSSIDSSSSSFDSYRSPTSYGSHRPLRDHPASLGSLAEVQETVTHTPLRLETADLDGKGIDDILLVETPTSTTTTPTRPRHARTGSRFVEDLESSRITVPPNLDRPKMSNSYSSTYSLHSLASTAATATPIGLYHQPAGEESSANLVAGEGEGEEVEDEVVDGAKRFGAGYRHRQLTVPWYEAVFCCACWGGQVDPDGDDEQDGQTMPAYV